MNKKTTATKSGIILPPHLHALATQEIVPAVAPEEGATAEEKATILPDPIGYKILCMVPDVSDKIAGTELDLVKPSDIMRQEEHATTVLFVMKIGDAAYTDQTKTPGKPWCKPGDFVIARTYSGTRLKIYGKEFRILNDDQVECTVDDPRGITRA